MYEIRFLDHFSSFTIAMVVFIIMLAFFYLGISVRKFAEAKSHQVEEKSLGAMEGSLLGLLALLLSFTFSMSSSRHDRRIAVIVEEANDIGTAILRADLYPDSVRAAFRKDFKAYLDSRIEFFEAANDLPRIRKSLQTSQYIQQSLWNRATLYGRDKENLHRTAQMIPALNAMIDIVTTRNAATIAKVPPLIIYLLISLCILSSLMMGYSVGKKPEWIIIFCFTATIVMTIYLIIDLDRPRRGLINMSDVNKQIVNLRSMFDKGE